MNVDCVRTRTRPQHEATEALMPLMAPGLTLAQYGATLGALYSVLAPWESYAAAHAPEELRALVARRRRAPLLEEDLRRLHQSPPAPKPIAEAIPGLAHAGAPDPADFLGAMYVVEGSSLGGTFLARHLEARFGLTPATGASYFRGYGEETGALWAQFKAVLGGLPDAAEDRVVSAAQAMFDLFAEALRDVLPAAPQIAPS